MIGFFDSGFGGLSIFRSVYEKLPNYNYLYLGDNAKAPYGNRSPDIIYKFTLDGVKWLFNKGANLIILACNTASSVALRKIQTEILPKYYPDKKVLGVIIPTAQVAASETKNKHIGVIGTPSTVNSKTFPIEISKLDKEIVVNQVSAPLLVPIIEVGELAWKGLDMAVKKYIDELINLDNKIDTLILGCTHYPLIKDIFLKYVPNEIKILSQDEIIPDKLNDYLNRHSELNFKRMKNNRYSSKFFSTENSEHVRNMFNYFYGSNINVNFVEL